jgi:RHS repeat-associated protein
MNLETNGKMGKPTDIAASNTLPPVGAPWQVRYAYTFGGHKFLKETELEGETPEVRLYLGGAEFVNGQPESYYHSEGRVALTGDKPAFQYKLTDHLGNTMVLFEDKDGDGIITTESMSSDPAEVEVLQRNFYYAFGLPMQGPWNHTPTDPDMPYLYNGKELEGELGLGWYAYGFRYYDASVGRWSSPDLLADWAPDLTPFRFGFNNPISYTDPNGLFESWIEARRHKRSNELKGRIRKNKESGEYEIHFKDSDGRVSRDLETKELKYAVKASYTGPSIRVYKPNVFEKVKGSGLIGGTLYGLTNDVWLTTQRFNPFDTHTTHLAGHYASDEEFTMGFVNTVATVIPIGRATAALKSVAPTGMILAQRLNAAQFSKQFKGTLLARSHPAIRGRMNSLLNKGIDNANTRLSTGNVLFQGAKIAGNVENEED